MENVLKNTTGIAMPNSKKLTTKKSTNCEAQLLSLSVKNIHTKAIWATKFLLLCLAFVSCRTAKENICIMPPPTVTKPPTIQYAQATFNGNVKDTADNLISDATVIFDNEIIGKTDAVGNFSYNASKRIDKNYTITIMKEGFNNCSKSYHTSMGNTEYKIQLTKPCVCDTTIIDNFCQCLQPISLTWSLKLLENEKPTLDGIVECLKSNPYCNLSIEYQIADNKRAAPDRVASLKKYIVNKGINENRIVTFLTTNNTENFNKVLLYKR